MNGTAKKILFVEDEPIAQIAYRNRLQRDGFETLFAENGAVALNRLSQFRPDLLVLDLMLPKANGAEVLKHVRSQEGMKETPVLILSNDYVSELSQKAMESGATRGMLKTECTPAKLAETVRDMLGYASPFDLSDNPVSDDSQAEAFIAAARDAHADEMTLKETREEFLKIAPEDTAKIREYCLAFIKAGTTPIGLEHLDNLFQHVRFFATRAGLSGCVRIALLASAFEALLFEIVFKPGRATASILQTVAQAVDSLERLCQKARGEPGEPSIKARILVVDDDAVSNRAMMMALKRAHFEPVSLEDPAKAIETAQATQHDIVLLDINMQGINGFELCEKLRAMPEYKETPILFVSSSGDFQSRARCILSGGNDLIPKPVSPVELVLKTTIRLLQPQGLWPETSTAANAQRLTAESHATPVHSGDAAILFDTTKLALSETRAASAAKNGSSFSTEMIKKAWSGSEPSKPIEPDKQIPTETPIKMGEAVNDSGKQQADSAETIKSPESKISTEPVKLVDEEKLRQIEALIFPPLGPEKLPEVNGEKKTDELKPVEIRNALPNIEMPSVPVIAPQPEQPLPLASEITIQSNPESDHTVLKLAPEKLPEMDGEKKADEPKSVETKNELPHIEVPPVPVIVPQPEQPAPLANEIAIQPHSESIQNTLEPVLEKLPDVSDENKTDEIKLPENNNEFPDVEIPPVTVTAPPPEQPAPLANETAIQPDPEPEPVYNTLNMETKNKPTFDDIARGVARIIFGDENITDMNVRLTRIALERYNVPATQDFDEVARGVAQIIFGDDNITDMNVRLTRIALERYNVTGVPGLPKGSTKATENGVSMALSSF